MSYQQNHSDPPEVPQLVYNNSVESAKNINTAERTIIPYFTLYNDRLVFHPRPFEKITRKIISKKSIDNLQKPKFQGNISKCQARIIRKKLTAWLSAVQEGGNQDQEIGRRRKHYPVFLTLTLPAQQIHTDQEIKRLLLDPIIKNMKRNYDVQEYFWRAETQYNGNIHFHLILDRYIPYKEALKAWNKILDTHGYIDLFEKKHCHRNPNSVDIRGCESVDNFIKYVLKYALKDEKNRKVQGRVYGMSDGLREINVYQGLMDTELLQELSNEQNKKSITVHRMDYSTIVLFNKEFYSSKLSLLLNRYATSYYKKLYLTVYAPHTQTKKVISPFKERLVLEPKQLSLFKKTDIKTDHYDKYYH